jgi:hypothetical protein
MRAMPPAIQLAWNRAKKKFRGYRGVLGVGLDRRRASASLEYQLVIYVLRKLPSEDVDKGQLVPRTFDGLRTDVRVPELVPAAGAPDCMVGDVQWIDWDKIHQIAGRKLVVEAPTHRGGR